MLKMDVEVRNYVIRRRGMALCDTPGLGGSQGSTLALRAVLFASARALASPAPESDPAPGPCSVRQPAPVDETPSGGLASIIILNWNGKDLLAQGIPSVMEAVRAGRAAA